MAARRSVATRPARPAPECETCGAEVWWAWSLTGKCWAALEPRRLPLDGTYGTFEVWRDAHGGLLCSYLEPGVRGDQDGSWRGVHHNAKCGRWPAEVTGALVREAGAVLQVMSDSDLLVLARRLDGLQGEISRQLRRRALADDDD